MSGERIFDFDVEGTFPNNIVKVLTAVLPGISDKVTVHRRPLRPTDPNGAIGVYATVWTPDEESHEMGHLSPVEPTLSSYRLGIQTIVKDGDTERGLAISSFLANHVRMMLYRNEPLRVALGSLYSETSNGRESARRWGVTNQRFMSNDVEGQFVTISVLDLWMETEMS